VLVRTVKIYMVSSDTYAPAPEVLMGLYSTRERAEEARERLRAVLNAVPAADEPRTDRN
jgi:hypothetical protein